jgi:hypothetical protein
MTDEQQPKHASGGDRESPQDAHPRPNAVDEIPGPRVEQEVGDAANVEELDAGPPPRRPTPDKPPRPEVERAADNPG